MLNKNIVYNQKNNKDMKKGFERDNKTGNPRKREGIDYRKNFVRECFDVVIFHESKAKKTEKQRKRQKEGTKRKQNKKDKKKERNKRERER